MGEKFPENYSQFRGVTLKGNNGLSDGRKFENPTVLLETSQSKRDSDKKEYSKTIS